MAMSDPWKLYRNIVNRMPTDEVSMYQQDLDQLLADADALLKVVRAIEQAKTEPNGYVFEKLGFDEIDAAYAALPEHLRWAE